MHFDVKQKSAINIVMLVGSAADYQQSSIFRGSLETVRSIAAENYYLTS